MVNKKSSIRWTNENITLVYNYKKYPFADETSRLT
jgi:hypothetical protein